MREWTEQEEQQMIALAKQGDPQANYELSQWALRRGEEEPEESRWNRLAAKCLVKAAQAGYAPAQARMAELLHASNDGAASAARPEEEEPAPARRTQRPAAWQEPEEEEPAGAGADFPYSLWFRTVRKVMSDQGRRLVARSPNAGCAVLRNAIAQYLLRYRGMRAQPEQIVIGSGSEQLYQAVVRMLGVQRTYAIEYPSYEQIEAVYRGAGAQVERLPIGPEGIESQALASARAEVLHVTPFHSWPTGVTAPAAKRYEYLQWAERPGRFIVEDDFDSEFFMPGKPLESLYSMDERGAVIYLNTFSRSLAPSMRMGYMILPAALLPVYERRVGMYSCSVPVLEQYALAEFIAAGHFERHLNRVRRRSRDREN